MAAITNEDIFGDDEAPESAAVIIPGSPSENSATSDENNSPSSVNTKGTAPSRSKLAAKDRHSQNKTYDYWISIKASLLQFMGT
jgi:hypothetical protein